MRSSLGNEDSSFLSKSLAYNSEMHSWEIKMALTTVQKQCRAHPEPRLYEQLPQGLAYKGGFKSALRSEFRDAGPFPCVLTASKPQELYMVLQWLVAFLGLKSLKQLENIPAAEEQNLAVHVEKEEKMLRVFRMMSLSKSLHRS